MTQRQQKYSRLLQKELGAIFQQDTKSMFGAAFITVSGVQVSPDFSIATVYLSLTLSKKPQVLLEEIREKGKQIRTLLSSRIRHQVRIIPELRFFIDDSLLEAERIDKLIASLNIPRHLQRRKSRTEPPTYVHPFPEIKELQKPQRGKSCFPGTHFCNYRL